MRSFASLSMDGDNTEYKHEGPARKGIGKEQNMEIERSRIPKAFSERLSLRFMKLRFTLQMLEDAHLPRYKSSAIRGGMGQMLLEGYCILDRRCGGRQKQNIKVVKEAVNPPDQNAGMGAAGESVYEKASKVQEPQGRKVNLRNEDRSLCPYEEECVVRRLMYAKFKIQPPFASEGDSIGYSVCCQDYREEFFAGDLLEFELTLFGRLLVHLNPILQAFTALGQAGLGAEHARFRIAAIANSRREPILDGTNIYLSRYVPETLESYVLRRLPHLSDRLTLRFRTPVTLKHNKEFLEHFDPEVILNACARRLYMLDCFEGIDRPQAAVGEKEENGNEEAQDLRIPVPRLVSETPIHTIIPRFSSTQETRIKLHGIRGEVILENVSEEAKILLAAGEVMQIGKNVSMGFGKSVLS